MADLTTTLAVWRPSRQWTVLYRHEPYAAALWALLFHPGEALMASEHFGTEWPRISAEEVITDHIVGYRTVAGTARERLVERLEPVRHLPAAWRIFSLTRALALSLAGIPADWPLRLDASSVTRRLGSRYADLMGAAVAAADALKIAPPAGETDALQTLLAMAHGLNPETPLRAPEGEERTDHNPSWPTDGALMRQVLIGTPVDCPTSHVEAMTRARRQWETNW